MGKPLERSYYDDLTVEVRAMLDERVAVAARKVVEALLERRSSSDGLYQLINRMMMLFQTPMSVAIYEVRRGEGKVRYKFLLHTVRDFQYRATFDNYHAGFHKAPPRGRGAKSDQFLAEDYWGSLIEIPASGSGTFAIRLFGFERNQLPEQEGILGAKPHEIKSHYIRWKLARMLIDRVERLAGSAGIDFNDYIQRSRPALCADAGFEQQKSDPESVENAPWLHGELSQAMDGIGSDRIARLLDREYQSVKDSALLRDGPGRLPNILFYTKTFDLRKKRFNGNYHYNVRWMIPQLQWADLNAALVRLSAANPSMSNDGDNWVTPGDNRRRARYPKESRSARIVALLKAADRSFWSSIRSRSGIDAILRLVSEPYDVHSRSFADPCLSSGIVQFRYLPYGIRSLSNVDNDEPTEAHIQRRVYMSYLLAMMAPAADKLAITSVPATVNGAPWLALCTVQAYPEFLDKWGETAAASARRREEVAVVDARHHLRNEMFFYGVAYHVIRNLRHKSKAEYLRLVAQCLEFALRNGAALEEQVDELVGRVNDCLQHLTRFFPYPSIVIERAMPSTNPALRFRLFNGPETSDNPELAFYLDENRWFDRNHANAPSFNNQEVQEALDLAKSHVARSERL